MTKIAIFTWRDIKNPKAGGSEAYFHEIAKRIAKKGNEVIWLTSSWKGAKKIEQIDGIKIIRRGSQFMQYLDAPISYFKYAKDADIIIDNENGIPFFTPLYAWNKKIFLHIHHIHKDVWFKEAKGLMKMLGVVGYILEKWLMPLAYRNKKIITISKSSAEEIEKEIGKNVLGIVNPGFSCQKIKGYKKYSSPTILFVNRVKKYKGIDTLIKAFKIVKKEISEARLIVAGTGDDLERLKQEVKEDNIKDIEFSGFVSDEKKQELMEKAWVFVNPSFKEGWGIVNIEASYYGLPIIGSNVAGIRDSIKNHESGELFSYGNAKELARKLVDMLKDDKKRKKLGSNGKKWAKQFSWESSADKYLGIIKGK